MAFVKAFEISSAPTVTVASAETDVCPGLCCAAVAPRPAAVKSAVTATAAKRFMANILAGPTGHFWSRDINENHPRGKSRFAATANATSRSHCDLNDVGSDRRDLPNRRASR
jgi:hypothetical protein